MFYDKRPKIALEKTKTQRIIEIATFASLGLALVFTVLNFNALPNQVPIHFNISGEVDNYGNKNFVWLPIVIGFGLCYGIYKLNKYPHLFNYSTKITSDNAEKIYTSAVKVMSLVNFMVAILLAIISYQVVSLGLSGGNKTATWSEYLIYLIIGIMTLAPLIWVVKIAVSQNKE